MMPDIDSDIYTKVVDLEKSIILMYILYIRYNRKLSKKSKKQYKKLQHSLWGFKKSLQLVLFERNLFLASD